MLILDLESEDKIWDIVEINTEAEASEKRWYLLTI